MQYSAGMGARLLRAKNQDIADRLAATPGPGMSHHLDRAITDAVQENEMTSDFTPDPPKPIDTDHIRDMASELTDRSLDGRGDERGRCPSTLFINGEHARCAGDRGHTDKHHSERLAAIWSRDETSREITYNPVGDKASEAEWEEFKAWKARKERSEVLVKTDSVVRDLFRFAYAGDTEFEGFRELTIRMFRMHEAGTIDLNVYDEGKSE